MNDLGKPEPPEVVLQRIPARDVRSRTRQGLSGSFRPIRFIVVPRKGLANMELTPLVSQSACRRNGGAWDVAGRLRLDHGDGFVRAERLGEVKALTEPAARRTKLSGLLRVLDSLGNALEAE